MINYMIIESNNSILFVKINIYNIYNISCKHL